MTEKLTFRFDVLSDFAVASAIFGAFDAGVFEAFEGQGLGRLTGITWPPAIGRELIVE